MTTEMMPNTTFGNNELLSPSGMDLLDEAEQHTEDAVADAAGRLEDATPLEEVRAAIVEQVAETLPDSLDTDTEAIERGLKRQRVMALTALEHSKIRRPIHSLVVQYPRRQYR